MLASGVGFIAVDITINKVVAVGACRDWVDARHQHSDSKLPIAFQHWDGYLGYCEQCHLEKYPEFESVPRGQVYIYIFFGERNLIDIDRERDE